MDPHRVQRVKDSVAEAQKLIVQITELPPDDAPHITALRNALAATIVHIHKMKTEREPYKPSDELNKLWLDASWPLQEDHRELAEACRGKAWFWLAPAEWKIAERVETKISIQDMQDALKRLVGDRVASIEEEKALKAETLKPERTDITHYLPNWIFDERKTKGVAFLATGIAAVVIGAWAVFTFVIDKGSKSADAAKQTPSITINNSNTNNNTVSPTISPQMNQNVIATQPAPSQPQPTGKKH